MIRPIRPMNKKLTPIGRALRFIGVCKFYHDGDGAGFVWRWWHPAAWVLAPLAFCGGVLAQGFSESLKYKHHLGFGLGPYWCSRKAEIKWDGKP